MMRLPYVRLFVLWFFLFCMNSFAYSKELSCYDITHDEIEKVWISEYSRTEFIVRLLLKEPYRQKFSELTRKNIGKRLKITIKGRVLSNATIKDEISSGIIFLGTFTSKDKAEEFIKNLFE